MLPKENRITKSAIFKVVTTQGYKYRTPHAVFYFFHDTSGQAPQLGLIVSKNIGNAVVRHRVSRLWRAGFAMTRPSLTAHTKVVIRAIHYVEKNPEELSTLIKQGFKKISQKPGYCDDFSTRSML